MASKKFLRSLELPGLADTYYVADDSLTESGAAADAKATGDKFEELYALPKIFHGTQEPNQAMNAGAIELWNAPNGSIYIMHT